MRIAFHEFAAILRDVRRPAPLRVRLGLVFRGPAWKAPGDNPEALPAPAAPAGERVSSA